MTLPPDDIDPESALIWKEYEAGASPAPVDKTPRNAPCPCGSGKKFKRCCDPTRAVDDAFMSRMDELRAQREAMAAQWRAEHDRKVAAGEPLDEFVFGTPAQLRRAAEAKQRIDAGTATDTDWAAYRLVVERAKATGWGKDGLGRIELGADSASTTSNTRGDLGRYVAGRERVLGRRVTVPEDPDGAAEVLAAIHGGERRAAAWLRQVLARLGERAA